ncbi:LytTR family transcriptional regulator, partial [bacterium]|nr:LytTR family transcriptional regulator [bacterium]
WLLNAVREQASAALMASLPGRVLLLKATRLEPVGVCLTLCPVDDQDREAESPPPLLKLPVSRGGGVALIPLDEAAYLRAEGHYTMVAIAGAAVEDGFCPLALAELETRLDPACFLRVHRSYIVNLRHAVGVKREDGRVMLVTAAGRSPSVPVGRGKVEAIRRLFAV